MTIPIDHNKMQRELDRRKYMGQIYTGEVETWQATQLGLKTYGKWCDLVSWKNLTGQKWTSTDDFMNLAIKRNWAEKVYDFDTKTNVCKQTKFGHDLFKTFEFWIDEKAQKRAKKKKQLKKTKIAFQKIVQRIPMIIQQICAIMVRFVPPEQSKSKKKVRDDNPNHTFQKWNSLDGKEWWKI